MAEHADIQELLDQADWFVPLIRSLLGDVNEVDDVVQETWMRALRRPPRLHGGRRSARAWLSRVGVRIALRRKSSAQARRWRESTVAAPENSVDPEAVAERIRLQREVAGLVFELQEPYRTAIALRYLEGHSSKELAQRLGIAEEAARKRVSRGLAQLRARLDRSFDDRTAWRQSLAAIVGVRAARPLQPALSSGALGLGWAWSTSAAALLFVMALWLSPRLFSSSPPARSISQTSSLSDSRGTDFIPGPLTAALSPERSVRERAAAGTSAVNKAALVDEPADHVHELHGRVLDPDGRAVEHALVTILEPDRSAFSMEASETTSVLARVRTNSLGEFSVSLPNSRLVDVLVDVQPFAVQRLPDRRAGERVSIELRQAVSLRAKLARKEDRTAIPNARYRLVQVWNPLRVYREITHGRSDAYGAIELERLPAGRLVLDVIGDEHCDVHAVLDAAAGERIERLFLAAPARPISGRVHSAIDGQPIAGARVVACPPLPGLGGTLAPEHVGRGWLCRPAVETDAQGRFALLSSEGLRPGRLFVEAPGHGSRSIPLGAALEGEFQVELQPSWVAQGRVISDELGAIAGVRVVATARGEVGGVQQADWREVRTNDTGDFTLTGLRRDLHYVLCLSKPGYAARIEVLARTAPRADLGALRLAPGSRVEGRILSQQGTALAGASVRLGSVAGDDRDPYREHLASPTTRADDQGHFQFTDVAAGIYLPRATQRGQSVTGPEIAVTEGSNVRDVQIVLAPVSDGVTGVVVDSAGVAVPTACVMILPTQGQEAAPAMQITAEDGRFAFESTAPGSLRLRVTPNSIHSPGGKRMIHAVELRDVVAGTGELQVVLPPAELITGSVRNSQGDALAQVMVFARDGSGDLLTYEASDAEGGFVLRLPPGAIADLSTKTAQGEDILHLRSVAAGTAGIQLVHAGR